MTRQYLSVQQREFVESDEPRLCYETGAPHTNGCGGATWALIWAAMRCLTRPKDKALFVAAAEGWLYNFNDSFKNMARGGPWRQKHWQSVPSGYVWERNGSRIEMVPRATDIPKGAKYNFIGIDNIDNFAMRDVGRILEHLRPGGRFRSTLHIGRFEETVGRRIRHVPRKVWAAFMDEGMSLQEAFAASEYNTPILPTGDEQS